MSLKTNGREKILKVAIEVFASQGYASGSVNSICEKGNISKGAMYHHFSDKDQLYLACLDCCFSELTYYLKKSLSKKSKDSLQYYFSVRNEFFEAHPDYQNLFAEATLMPPQKIETEIKNIKKDFDVLNLSILRNHLSDKPLQSNITIDQAVEIFTLFQDCLNSLGQITTTTEFDINQHEALRSRALDILLYGIIEREQDKNEQVEKINAGIYS